MNEILYEKVSERAGKS